MSTHNPECEIHNVDQTLYSQPSERSTNQYNPNLYQQQAPMNPQPQSVMMNQQPYMGQQPYMVQQPYIGQQPYMGQQYVPRPLMICGGAVPIVDTTTALILLILNIVVFPGLGTMVLGCLNHNQPKCRFIWIGFAQLFTAFCCVGWVWSIVTGIKVLQAANINAVQMQIGASRGAVIGRPVPQNNVV